MAVTALELSTHYQTVIREVLGLPAQIEQDDTVVRFSHPQMGTLLVLTQPDDPEYLCLLFPGFLSGTALGLTPEQMRLAVCRVNARVKSCKLLLAEDGDRVGGSVEAFLGAPGEMPPADLLVRVLGRNLSALHAGATALVEAAEVLRKETANA